MSNIKENLYKTCANQLKAKITEVNDAIALQREANSGDTKSSAGDKYETSTAMTHLELEKLGNQLSLLENDLRKLNSIQYLSAHKSIELGSLVKTERHAFWISIGVGEVKLDKEKIYVISPLSPIGQQMLGKVVGAEFIFNKTKVSILEIS